LFANRFRFLLLLEAREASAIKKCQIRATMDGDLIAAFDYEGDEGLCQRYAARLRPY
jgi:hypothetical protein